LLNALRQGASITTACQAEGIHRVTYYQWLENDPEFAAAAGDAIESGTDRLEQAALERAIAGSDTLTIFLLKSRRPDTYREPKQVVEHTGKDGAPLVININRVTKRDD
jgi:hypothetical protein